MAVGWRVPIHWSYCHHVTIEPSADADADKNLPSHRPRPAILRTVAVSSAARTGTVEAKSKASAEPPFFAPGEAMELKGNHQV